MVQYKSGLYQRFIMLKSLIGFFSLNKAFIIIIRFTSAFHKKKILIIVLSCGLVEAQYLMVSALVPGSTDLN